MERSVLQNGEPDPAPSPARRSRCQPNGREGVWQVRAEMKCLLFCGSRARDLLIEHLHFIQHHCYHTSAAYVAAPVHDMRLHQAEGYRA